MFKADYKFVYIDVGFYGTASDSEIFKTSQMGKRLSDNQLNIPFGRHLPNDDDGNIPFSVVGDEAFGLGNHILRPYAKRNLNYTTSSCRDTVQTTRMLIVRRSAFIRFR